MSSHPSQSESNAMAAFLASAKGDLTERARLFNSEVARIQKEMQDKENLAGGSKDEQTKNTGAVE